MPLVPLVKVTSPSFSKEPALRGELSAAFPGAVFNDAGTRLAGDALARYLSDAEGAIIGLEPVDAKLLAACPRLRIVSKYGVGLDNIDADACRARGVAIGWTGGVNRRSVSEQTLCFMIGLFRNVFVTANLLRGGKWDKSGGRQLTGTTVGIIGLGFVGQDLTKLLAPFRCDVIANDIADVSGFASEHGVRMTSKEEIYETADVVTLHVPLTSETRFLIDEPALARFRKDAFLINTSRGEVVRLAALKRALREGRLAGAALDVFEVEPPTDTELLSLPNIVTTAHIGGNAREAVLAMGRSAIGHLARFFEAR
jgi:D-3-phosphoglycerate dehydrogenase